MSSGQGLIVVLLLAALSLSWLTVDYLLERRRERRLRLLEAEAHWRSVMEAVGERHPSHRQVGPEREWLP